MTEHVPQLKALLGLIFATGSAMSSKALSEGVIPDGVEEVTMYSASLVGLLIAIFILIAAIQKQIDRYNSKHPKN
jgi:hypothetical protein